MIYHDLFGHFRAYASKRLQWTEHSWNNKVLKASDGTAERNVPQYS